MDRVLVIKLGALGDFIQATGAFADIRAHHPHAHITLMTTSAMMPLIQESTWFDALEIDERKPFWNFPYLLRLRRRLSGYDMIYDLQTNQRTGWYFRLANRPPWNGIAAGCRYPHTNPSRNNLHTLDRLREQLEAAGVEATHAQNVDYLQEDISAFLQEHHLNSFVCLVPGGAAHRPGKRWPHFAELASMLQNKGYGVALVGGPGEKDLLADISRQSGAVNLGGKTGFAQLASIFREAQAVIGNDTGPMHLAAATGTKGVVLFGPESAPDLCAPRSPDMHILHAPVLANISSEDILASLPSL